LAANSIGAVFSAIPTDAGVDAIAGRVRTIQPKMLFVDDSAYYNGKVVNVLSRVATVMDLLSKESGALPSDFQVISHHNPLVSQNIKWEAKSMKCVTFEEWLKSSNLSDRMSKIPQIKFEQLSLSHPTIIVFSSGTTGEPKAIVHSQSIAINQRKEKLLQFDAQPMHTWGQITSTGWIMWCE